MSKTNLLLMLAATCLALTTGMTAVSAQVTTGAILGVVQDTTSGKLPGATVDVKNLETAIVRTVTADEQGRYRASNLGLGTYEITASLAGFKTEIRSGVTLSIGREAVLDFTLAVGDMAEKVVVVGEAPLVETTNAITATIVDERQIKNLPLNGRDLTQLTLLTAGVLPVRGAATRASNGFTTKLSVNGGRPQSNSFLLDGTDINANSNNTPGSVAGVQLGVDSVREFRVITNAYSAEFGRAGAGVISSVTKSGTNAFRGSVFAYHRSDALDAKNFFDTQGKPDFTRHQFGFSLGGPVRTDRTFFFLNFEGLREDLGVSTIANVPTEATRAGRLPTSTVAVNSAIVPYMNLFPLPNGRDFGDGRAEYRQVISQPTREYYVVGRGDHMFSKSDSLFGRYTFDDGMVNTPDRLNLSSHDLRSRSQWATVEEKRILGAHALNAVRFAFNRTHLAEFDATTNQDFQRLFFLPEATLALPGLGVTGLSTWGSGNSVPKIYTTNVFQIIDELTYQRSRHLLKAGVNFERVHFDQRSEISAGGGYSFDSLTNFLINNPRTFAIQLPGSDTFRRIRSSLVAAYVQDDIKLAPHLTVNVGLRWETITDPTEADGKVAVLRNILEPTASLRDITTGGPLFHAPKKNFAPRVGVAWSPTKSDKTVVRAGFGLFYDTITNAYYQLGFARMPPFRNGVTLDRSAQPIIFPNWRAMNLTAESAPAIESFPFEPDAPRYYRHSVNLQQQLTETTVVSVTYTGARGVNLLRHMGIDLAEPQILADGSRFYPTPGRLRNPNFGSIRYKLSDGTAKYNGLTVDLRKRWADDFQFQGAFTLGKSLDDGSGAAGNGDFAGDNTVPRELFVKDRGRSPWDVRRSFVASAVYDLPFGSGKRWAGEAGGASGVLISGWQISSILTIADGSPFSALRGFVPTPFIAGSSDQSYYPDLVPGANANPVLGGPDKYYDPSSFAIPAAGRVGNLGRNTLVGPGIASVDLSLVKNTRLGGERAVQFRLDAFNVLNRANFALPQNNVFQTGSTVPRPDAGRITTTVTTARQVQLALRFTF